MQTVEHEEVHEDETQWFEPDLNLTHAVIELRLGAAFLAQGKTVTWSEPI